MSMPFPQRQFPIPRPYHGHARCIFIFHINTKQQDTASTPKIIVPLHLHLLIPTHIPTYVSLDSKFLLLMPQIGERKGIVLKGKKRISHRGKYLGWLTLETEVFLGMIKGGIYFFYGDVGM
ncbi:hypothetical protein DM02DRAFT_193973 [Periconia macrospinosa]|uniref:Uncharacterized protein n=1 Tax=Periconia macrospinosa TaxID=97972 RepID=A0A2V1DAY0_9PLEO|nr:hypothetical protein DM02DRAFT_193973 [Periconia macrospinosa]